MHEKELFVEGIESPDGYLVQAREESTWKKITGLGKALQVQIIPSGTTDVLVNIGAGTWADKAGAAAVGAIVFAPLLVTSAVGAYLQNKLPDEIFEVIERYIMSGGHSVRRNVTLERTDPLQTKCPSCGAMNPKSTKFCSGCGTKLAASCPSCGKDVDLGKKFCPHCGSAMTVSKMNTCPSCGAEVPEGKKFCSECGASLADMNKNKCSSCGAMVDKELRFCPECGSSMSDKKVCIKCGAELNEGQKFCGKCGAKME
ncbi:MAG: zinc-ribbon domain-containing protein [Schwartzia sp.]|nr:zinc-ribbon domain-containing protein [Schwartzia sp. (in: firmicutes)]